MTTNNHVRSLQFSKEVRLPKLVEMLNGGATLQQYAETVGVNYRTAIRDKREMRHLLKTQFQDSVEEYRQGQLEELGSLRDELLELKEKAKGINDPETQIQLLGALIEQGLKILDREMRLMGTVAPTKSITAHVDATTRQHELLEHSHGLSDDQLQLVYAYMDGLPRAKVTVDFAGFNLPKKLEASNESA